MAPMTARSGPPELRQALRQSRGAFVAVAVFSFICNALMLTGPLYMMQVYDRVLAARSAETLVALSLLACGLFAMMGLLDAVRGRIMLMLGARVQQALDPRVFRASLRRLARDPDHLPARTASADLEAVQRLFASPAMLAMFDLPWTPFFAALIFVFHPALGALAVAGGAVLVALTLLNRRMAERPAAGASRLNAEAERTAQATLAESEVVRALGMRTAVLARWQQARLAGLVKQGLSQRARVRALEREEARLEGEMGALAAREAEARGRISEYRLQALGLSSQRREEAISQLRDIEHQQGELAERRRALSDRIARLEIRAPAAGRVLGLTISPKAVLKPAEPLLQIVPQDGPLVVQARIPPLNVEEVQAGQAVRLVLPAFSARAMPELEGRVIQVTPDTMHDDQGNSFYLARIDLAVPEGMVLTPGMPAEAFIRTGRRSPMAYLLHPLTSYFDRAFRES